MANEFAANLFLAFATRDISWSIKKLANAFPKSERRFIGYAKRLESYSIIFLFLAFTLNDLRTHRGSTLRQRYLDSCVQFVSIFHALEEGCRIYSKGKEVHELDPFDLCVFERVVRPLDSSREFNIFLYQIEINILFALQSASMFFADVKSWRNDWPAALKIFFKELPKSQIRLRPDSKALPPFPFPWPLETSNMTDAICIEEKIFPAVGIAVVAKNKLQEDALSAVKTFDTTFQGTSHGSSTAGTERKKLNSSIDLEAEPNELHGTALITPQEAKICPPELVQSQGTFLVSLDYGRPKSRSLILSTDCLYLLRENRLIDQVIFQGFMTVLCHYTAENPLASDARAIAVCWKSGTSGKDLRIRAIKVFFSDDESLYLWTSFLKGPSVVNTTLQCLTAERYFTKYLILRKVEICQPEPYNQNTRQVNLLTQHIKEYELVRLRSEDVIRADDDTWSVQAVC